MVRFLLPLLLVLSLSVSGQDYSFSVPSFICTVEIRPDQSLLISYEIMFDCDWGAHPIDIVDIGFPTEDYDPGSVEASVDGNEVRNIRPSEYIDVGVEVHLGAQTIHQGEKGLFRLQGVNPGMVFRDSGDEGYASVRFTPTWFDGDLLTGSSDFRLVVIFPPGAGPDDVRYHERPFTAAEVDSRGRVVFTWEERRRVDSSWTAGVSFPAELVDGPLRDRPRPPLITAEQIERLLPVLIPLVIVGLFVWGIAAAVVHARRRRVSYLPPRIGLEGSGIRRGLTAPMAAMLLEEDLQRVLVLIIYGMLRKGALRLVGRGDDARVEKTGAGGKLRRYEQELLDLLPEPGSDLKIPPAKIQGIFVDIVKELKEKMEGFSLGETREYYRHIIRNAWEMVRKAGSAEKAGRILADRFGWLFADRDFDRNLRTLPDVHPSYTPVWFQSIAGTGGISAGPGGFSLSRFCAGIASTLEGAAGSAVRSISSLSASVTSVTNPIPVSSGSYSGRSGGSSCACACACAGCACACAGGGR